MVEAAHPQHDAAGTAGGEEPNVLPHEAGETTVQNPFPKTVTVPDESGTPVEVELVVLDGVVYAPLLDQLPLSPGVRQYITQYCAAWSSSVLTLGKVQSGYPAPPRRAQLVFAESQIHAMLGLAHDETVVAVVVDPMSGTVQFVVDSPRLPRKSGWDSAPPQITLPIAAWYERPETGQ